MNAANRMDPGNVDEALAKEREAAAGVDAPLIGSVRDAAVSLTKVEEFTTFFAEYAFVGGDIVVHFFWSPELLKVGARARERYFLELFPQILSDTAERYFNATRPRIFAEYVPEMTSWYFCGRGFANRLTRDGFVMHFLAELDAALDHCQASSAESPGQ